MRIPAVFGAMRLASPFSPLALVLAAGALGLASGVSFADGADLIVPVAATAQSCYFVPDQDDRRAQHAIDGGGMTPDGPVATTSVCGNNPNGLMWLSGGNTDTWITLDLGSAQTVAGFHLWNYNEGGAFVGRGVRKCRIYAGADLLPDGAAYDAAGAAWGTLVGEMTFAQATGAPNYAGEDYLFATPVTTRYLQLLVTSNFGTSDGYAGIAEIRFIRPGRIISFGANVAGSTVVIGPVADNAATIAWTVPFGTDLASLAPGFRLSFGTCDKGNGGPVPFDFRNPVTYAVTVGEVTNTYTVTAATAPPSTACDLKAFRVNLVGSRASILSTGPASGNVVVNVPPGTTDAQLAALAPTLTVSPGAAWAIPTPSLSLSAPVHYIVTAEDGVTTHDYTATVTTDGGAFRLFALKTAAQGLAAADYDYLALVPASKHLNNGAPAIIAISSESDLTDDIYLRDYLRRYNPSEISTINLEAAVPGCFSSAIFAAGPLELSALMATQCWASSARVVLVSDAVDDATYPDVLQASALAAALDAPLIYHDPDEAKARLVREAIARLGASEVVYVGSAGPGPDLATRALAGPADIVNYLAQQGITVDYFAAANPSDLSLVSGAKLSLTAPFVAARRGGIVVPITTYAPLPNATECFHHTGYPAIKSELEKLYEALGRYPSYLALVGNATSIPLSYLAPNTQAGDYNNAPTDLDYANADDDPFPDIAIGRIMAYDVFDAALLTSRTSTYEQLYDGVWERTMADVGGQWNAAYLAALMGNCGFGYTSMLGGTGDGQPVNAGFIAHNDHSDYHHIGGAFDVNSRNVLAPAVIASEGCATAAIDFETLSEDGGGVVSDRGRGVLAVNQLLKLGAVGYLGSTRSETGAGQMTRSRFVNALLAGEPLGRCYRAAMDVFSVDGLVTDQRRNRILLGDPGLRIRVPSAPVVAPASHVVTEVDPCTDIIEVRVPSALFTSEVDPTWCSHWGLTYPQYWGEKPGLYGMDVDRFYQVRFTPRRRVASVEELDVWPTVNCWTWGNVKLGLMGTPTVDHRQDGTDQLVWALRANIMDWAGAGGGKVPLAQMTSARFKIHYLTGKDMTSFDANLPGSSVSARCTSDIGGSVVVYVPPGTTDEQIAALAPTYALDVGATCSQPSGATPSPPLSTAAPVRYVVTPQDADDLPAKVYSVVVTRDTPPFTYSRWTGDADSGLSGASQYTVAVNLGGSAVTVNGVAFQASALEGKGFSIAGGGSWVNGGTPRIAGDGQALASDFLYGGTPLTVTLSGLAPGATYETALFSYGWEGSGRTETFASGDDSRVVDQDAFGVGEGIRITYTFIAGPSGSQAIRIAPAEGSAGTFHLCALANRLVRPPATGGD